jgi:hypothetical protein
VYADDAGGHELPDFADWLVDAGEADHLVWPLLDFVYRQEAWDLVACRCKRGYCAFLERSYRCENDLRSGYKADRFILPWRMWLSVMSST